MGKRFINNFKHLFAKHTLAYILMPLIVAAVCSRIMTANILLDILLILLLSIIYLIVVTLIILIEEYVTTNKWYKQKRRVKKEIHKLNSVEQELIAKRYNLFGKRKVTYGALAKKYNIPRKKLRSIERNALDKIFKKTI